MIRLNLLPFRAARKKENVRRQVSIILLVLIFCSIVMVYFFISLNSQITKLNADIKTTKAEIAKYQKKVDQIAKIKKQLNLLKQKKKVIDTLETNRKEPAWFFDAMTKLIIARRMYLNTFSATGSNVKMTGIAIDNQTIADFMSRLQKSGLFRSVNLGPITTKRVRNANLKTFRISCVKSPQGQKTNKPKAKK